MRGELKNYDNMHEKVFILSAIVFNLLVRARS
jgi:hypothetical protein